MNKEIEQIEELTNKARFLGGVFLRNLIEDKNNDFIGNIHIASYSAINILATIYFNGNKKQFDKNEFVKTMSDSILGEIDFLESMDENDFYITDLNKGSFQ